VNAVVAIKSIAHKFARAVFHVLGGQLPFDPTKAFVCAWSRRSATEWGWFTTTKSDLEARTGQDEVTL
jgi:hypothetical protein